MKQAVLIILALFLTATAALAAAKEISSTEAQAMLAKNKQLFLLDVRTPEEYRQAHIRDARLIPITELERRIGEIPKDRTVIVYCAVGSRSRSAVGLLAQRGIRDLYTMKDGIVGWYRNGYPVDR